MQTIYRWVLMPNTFVKESIGLDKFSFYLRAYRAKYPTISTLYYLK
jgi:hypothetical protein